MSDQDRKDFLSHFPQHISQELTDYVNNTALLSSRYLFTRRAAGVQFAYCTHCQKEQMTDGHYKHNHEYWCKHCKSFCIAKASGRGRKKLINEAYVVWYDKSLINPNAITARGLHVKRDYSGDYKKVKTMFSVQTEYLFESGSPKGIGKTRFGSAQMASCGRFRKKVHSERNRMMVRLPLYLLESNIATAVDGTIFQYSEWQRYFKRSEFTQDFWHGFNIYTRRAGEPLTDLTEFFDLSARYPCVEYLTKMGLKSVVESRLENERMHNLIYWRGLTLEKVLRMSKNEIKELRNASFEITTLSLESYNFHKKAGIPLSIEQAHLVRDLTFEPSVNDIKKIAAPLERIVMYVIKQLGRPGANKHYKKASNVVSDWRDYLGECVKLGMDPKEEQVLYPNDLHRAHLNTTRKVKLKEDATLNIKIAERLKDLEKYIFEQGDFIIRPAVSSIELFEEGKALRHCVGGYADRYAKGDTIIFFIRRSNEPEKPFYTLEFRNGIIAQCQGFKRCAPTTEVQAFINLFTAKKLLTKKRTRVDVTNIQQVQGEAV